MQWKIGSRLVEPFGYWRAVRIGFGRCKFGEIDRVHQFVVQHYIDHFALAGNGVAVPLAWLLHHLLFRSGLVTKKSTTLPGFGRIGPLFGVIVGNLNLY